MENQMKCRMCQGFFPAKKIVPGFMGIGSLFGEEEANEIVDSLFCAKCEHKALSEGMSMEILDCGHHSIIHKDQHKHACFYPSCAASNSQSETDDCIFCSEVLATSACVTFKCGHLFHKNCIETHLRKATDPGEPISLNGYACPFCKEILEWEGDDYHLSQIARDVAGLRQHLEHMIKAQIAHEKIGMPSNVLDYGMRHFNFYRCNKCTSIYYGGKRECGASDEKIDKALLICGGCRGCSNPAHKDEYMVYKCKFCCSPATWFCFGHTHFCEPCHNEAYRLTGGNNNNFVKADLKQCTGKDCCPLGIDHPPHGEEFALYCGACRDDTQDPRVFVGDMFGYRVYSVFLDEAEEKAIELEEERREERRRERNAWDLFGDDEPEEPVEPARAAPEPAVDLFIGGLFGEEEPKDADEDADDEWFRRIDLVEGADSDDEAPRAPSIFDEDDESMGRMGNLFNFDDPKDGDDESMVIRSLFDDEEVQAAAPPAREPTKAGNIRALSTSKDGLPRVNIRRSHESAAPFAHPRPAQKRHPSPIRFLYDNWRGLAVLAAAAVLNSASYTVV